MSATDEVSTQDEGQDYSNRLGERLRSIRRQKGLSLHEVEDVSQQEFKASVLGAYERGERAISVPRLQRLAQVYSVPVDQLLPPGDSMGNSPDEGIHIDLTDGGSAPRRGRVGEPVTIDLTRLDGRSGAEAQMLSRYLTMIQMQRQDFNGRVLTVRRDDLRAIACILDTTVESAYTRLDDLGLSRS